MTRRADECRTCPAFRFASGQTNARGGEAAAKTAREFRKLLAADEAPSDDQRRRWLAELDDAKFNNVWSLLVDALFNQNVGEAEDKGEGFESPMARQLERMDDARAASPPLRSNGATDDPPDFPGKPKVGGGMVPLDKRAMDSRMAFDMHRVRGDDGKARGQVFVAGGIRLDHREILDGIEKRMEGRQ